MASKATELNNKLNALMLERINLVYDFNTFLEERIAKKSLDVKHHDEKITGIKAKIDDATQRQNMTNVVELKVTLP